MTVYAYVIVCLFHCLLFLYYAVYITALMRDFIMLLLLLKLIKLNSIQFKERVGKRSQSFWVETHVIIVSLSDKLHLF